MAAISRAGLTFARLRAMMPWQFLESATPGDRRDACAIYPTRKLTILAMDPSVRDRTRFWNTNRNPE